MHAILKTVAIMAVTMAFSGCITQQGEQQSDVGQAMMGELAHGLMSGAGSMLGHGIASGNKRYLAVAAAQAALGTATTAAAASSSSRKSPATRSAPPSSGSYEGYPDTPQCRAFMRFARRASSAALAGATAAYTRLVQMEHACLASAPKHPLSRSKACGEGKYFHNLNGRNYCGWQQASEAFGRWDATNIRGMPAQQYLQTYGLMSLFR